MLLMLPRHMHAAGNDEQSELRHEHWCAATPTSIVSCTIGLIRLHHQQLSCPCSHLQARCSAAAVQTTRSAWLACMPAQPTGGRSARRDTSRWVLGVGVGR